MKITEPRTVSDKAADANYRPRKTTQPDRWHVKVDAAPSADDTAGRSEHLNIEIEVSEGHPLFDLMRDLREASKATTADLLYISARAALAVLRMQQ